MPKRCRGWRACATRCGWSTPFGGGPGFGPRRRRADRRCLGTTPARRKQRCFDRRSAQLVGATAAGDRGAARRARSAAASRIARRARRWSTRSAASLRDGRPRHPRARPDPMPSGSPDRRPIRSSFRRRAWRRSLPSRCAAKIRLLAVTPEPQLATNGFAGSTPASANSALQLVERLEGAVVTVERAERQVAGARNVARRDAGARIGLAAFEARLCRGRRAAAAPRPARMSLLGDDLAAALAAHRTRAWRGCGSPLSVGRPSASHFWKPPSRIATCSAPKWRSMNQPRAAVRVGRLS